MPSVAYNKKGKMLRRSDPLTSLLLVFPLFVVYQIGVLSMPSTYNGADLIIAHGISLCPVHIKPDFLSTELGVPVIEGIGAPIRMAAMLAGLGLKHSRKRWPKSSARPNV